MHVPCALLTLDVSSVITTYWQGAHLGVHGHALRVHVHVRHVVHVHLGHLLYLAHGHLRPVLLPHLSPLLGYLHAKSAGQQT